MVYIWTNVVDKVHQAISDAKESDISQSVNQTLLNAFTVTLELDVNTQHASQVSVSQINVFTVPVTLNLFCMIIKTVWYC